MTGNATFCFDNTAVLSVCAVDAPRVVTSAEFDERLAETYRRVGLRAGLFEGLAGITERRWWPQDVSFADAAAMAGAKALAEAGVDPADIGLLINTSVSPGPPRAVDRGRGAPPRSGLPTSCLNFDLANACLGFVNGDAARRHDDRRRPDPTTRSSSTARTPGIPTRPPSPGCARPDATREDFIDAVRHAHARLRARRRWCSAAADRAPRGPPARRRRRAGRHRAPRAVRRRPGARCAPTRKGCSTPGWPSSRAAWDDAQARLRLEPGMDRYIIHQVSQVHTERDVPTARASTRPACR